MRPMFAIAILLMGCVPKIHHTDFYTKPVKNINKAYTVPIKINGVYLGKSSTKYGIRVPYFFLQQ